jgi:sodium-dependent multivitamin transporter 6/sodium-coupled monocarboxylate transporter 8/12
MFLITILMPYIFSCRVLYFTGPAFFITLSLATLEGVVAYAYYTTIGCDPVTSGQIKNPNQVKLY